MRAQSEVLTSLLPNIDSGGSFGDTTFAITFAKIEMGR